MQIHFDKKEMDKNIEFTIKLYSMNDLKEYKVFFDEFLKNQWKRVSDKRMNLEKFIELMGECDFFVSKLFVGEDYHIPFRYAVNARNKKKDGLFEMCCDLTGENFAKVQNVYFEIYDRFFT